MRKQDKKKFIEELGKNPNVSIVCRILNVSRDTFYRWRKEDPDFEIECDEAVSQGRAAYFDLAESKLISSVNAGDKWAIIAALKMYAPRTLTKTDEGEKVTGNEIVFRNFSDPSKEKEIRLSDLSESD